MTRVTSDPYRIDSRGRYPGFTILELLVVMALITILAALTLPSISSVTMGSSLSVGGDKLQGFLQSARQSALAQNHQVEVRFYQYPDLSQPGESIASSSTWHFHGFQMFQISDSGSATPLGKLQKLPQGIVIDANPTLSSLLTNTKTFTPPLDPQVSLPNIGTSYNCSAFRFRANGSTGLSISPPSPPGVWCLTLHSLLVPGSDNLSSLPTNYITLQIDPISGAVVMFRPTL